MQIIVSHVNTDFDALASMIAAKKLYPNASVVISDKQNIPVKQFLTIYRETLDLIEAKQVDWLNVTELILVDVASLARVGDYVDQLSEDHLTITIYDHHPVSEGDTEKDHGIIEQTGAAVTLLIEELKRRSLPISSFEATLFGLGIYTDTGAFIHSNTTARDFQAAGYLMEQGMNLDIVQRFSEAVLLPGQQELLHKLFQQITTYDIEGLNIAVGSYNYGKFQQGLASITQKLLEVTEADALLTVVEMNKRIFIVGRANSDRITLLPLLEKWQGGGHEQAGSASIKHGDLRIILHDVKESLQLMIKPAVTARDMMTSPVKTIPQDTTIEEAGRLMYRYGHSGFPVVEAELLVGMVTRRDLEKANHHGLGHAPVKAYMSTNVVSIAPETTAEEIQQIIIEQNIGRLPVVQGKKMIGIVSRTNIIETLHHQTREEAGKSPHEQGLQGHLQAAMKEQLPKDVYSFLQAISTSANDFQIAVYLIGGMVRDLFLGLPNEDVDIVVEGDAIAFTKHLQADYGGEVITHESFRTATWLHPEGLEIDLTSSRLEYYDRPAALPNVETSTLKEDLYRRDFTINAMAISLNQDAYGELIDPFRGKVALREKKITILHNLSFVEDPTRILRGVRFETRFHFLMDEQTEQLALQSMSSVKDLSANRIVDEMRRLLIEEDPARSIKRLFELSFWQQFDVKKIHAEGSYVHALQLHSLYTEHDSIGQPSWFAYFLVPFYEAGKMDQAKPFTLTKKDAALAQAIVNLQSLPKSDPAELGELHRSLKGYSEEAIMFLIAKGSFPNGALVMKYLERRRVLPIFLTGKDFIQQGLQPGALFSELLLDLDVAVLNEEVTTKEEATDWLKNQINHLN